MWVTFLVSELVMNIGWHKRNQIELYGNGTTIFTTNHSKHTFISQNCSYFFFGNSVIVSFALYSVRFCSFCQFVLIFYSTLFIFLSLIFKHFFLYFFPFTWFNGNFSFLFWMKHTQKVLRLWNTGARTTLQSISRFAACNICLSEMANWNMRWDAMVMAMILEKPSNRTR